MDQMLGTYTCKRKSHRWPLALFYNMLDVMALADHIIYADKNSTAEPTSAAETT